MALECGPRCISFLQLLVRAAGVYAYQLNRLLDKFMHFYTIDMV